MKNTTKTNILFFALGAIITVITILAIQSINKDNLTGDVIIQPLTPGETNLAQPAEETRDKPSPENYFTEEQIKVYKDRVVLDAENLQWASFEDTKSMLPVINKDTNALQRVPKCPEEIAVGDIVSYDSDYSDSIIIHRVAFIGEDEEGVYFVMKGDNNPTSDPGKVRCFQIQREVVAVIY
ncbi:MAG: hypothetical protein ACP5N3_05405 [Candidatus Nanoarchaeia archaeon]